MGHVLLHGPPQRALSFLAESVSFVDDEDLEILALLLPDRLGRGYFLDHVLNDEAVVIVIVCWSDLDVVVAAENSVLDGLSGPFRLQYFLLFGQLQ